METKNQNTEFLQKLYENAQMGAESIRFLSERTENKTMLEQLRTESEQYKKIKDAIVKFLNREGEEPKEQNPAAKFGVWSGIQLNTMMDKSNDKLAEMMIQGGTMGIIDLSRLMREYSDVPEDYILIGEALIKLEENSNQRMKLFLGNTKEV